MELVNWADFGFASLVCGSLMWILRLDLRDIRREIRDSNDRVAKQMARQNLILAKATGVNIHDVDDMLENGGPLFDKG